MMRGPSTPCGDVRAELAGDSDLTIMRPRTRPNGEPCEVEVRWVIYHMLEHFAGHFGQILLLQHARQALGVGDAAAFGGQTAGADPFVARSMPGDEDHDQWNWRR